MKSYFFQKFSQTHLTLGLVWIGVSTGIANIIQTVSGSAEELYATYKSLTDLRSSLRFIGVADNGLTGSMLYGAGGLDPLASAVQIYTDNFLSASERLQLNTSSLSDEFTALGLTMPTTSDGFKALLKSFDTTTEAGQEMYGRTILLSEEFAALREESTSLNSAFKSLTDSIQNTIDTLYSNMTGGQTQVQMIGSFWETKSTLDTIMSQTTPLSDTDRDRVTALIDQMNSLALNIQKAGTAPAIAISNELISALTGQKTSIDSKMLPSFDVGSAYIPNDMTANIHKGEIIINPTDSDILRKYGIPNLAFNQYDTRPMLTAIYNKIEEFTGYMKRLDDNFDSVLQGNVLRVRTA